MLEQERTPRQPLYRPDFEHERAAGEAGQIPENKESRLSRSERLLHGPCLRYAVRFRDHPPVREYPAGRQLCDHLPRGRRPVLRRVHPEGADPSSGGRLQRRLRQGALRRQAGALSPQKQPVRRQRKHHRGQRGPLRRNCRQSFYQRDCRRALLRPQLRRRRRGGGRRRPRL